jgi:hypothetical protein
VWNYARWQLRPSTWNDFYFYQYQWCDKLNRCQMTRTNRKPGLNQPKIWTSHRRPHRFLQVCVSCLCVCVSDTALKKTFQFCRSFTKITTDSDIFKCEWVSDCYQFRKYFLVELRRHLASTKKEFWHDTRKPSTSWSCSSCKLHTLHYWRHVTFSHNYIMCYKKKSWNIALWTFSTPTVNFNNTSRTRSGLLSYHIHQTDLRRNLISPKH